MATGKGVANLVARIHEAAHGNMGGVRRDGPLRYAKAGPWRAELEGKTGRLLHYGTKMLEWHYDMSTFPTTMTITGTWTGLGSVSDQTGVNAALRALGSPMRYSRDDRGGGPRVNPYQVQNAGIHSLSPPQYNARRRHRRRLRS